MAEFDPLTGTAFGTAHARRVESARPDRLFDDPLAGLLVDAAGPAMRAFWQDGDGARLAAAMGDFITLRTRWFDDFALMAARAGCPQIVILAAGLDARAFRLDWPAGTRIFELDRPAVLEHKTTVLRDGGHRPRCERISVACDLRFDWVSPVREAGFDPGRPSAWLVEGLLVYLSAAEADTLLADISALAGPGSRLAVEHLSTPALGDMREAAEAETPTGAIGQLATLWANDLATDPADWIAGYGWQPRRDDLPGLAGVHGRPVPPVFDPGVAGTARLSLISALRHAGPSKGSR